MTCNVYLVLENVMKPHHLWKPVSYDEFLLSFQVQVPSAQLLAGLQVQSGVSTGGTPVATLVKTVSAPSTLVHTPTSVTLPVSAINVTLPQARVTTAATVAKATTTQQVCNCVILSWTGLLLTECRKCIILCYITFWKKIYILFKLVTGSAQHFFTTAAFSKAAVLDGSEGPSRTTAGREDSRRCRT